MINRPRHLHSVHPDPAVEYVIYSIAAPPFFTGGFDDIESLLLSIRKHATIAGTTRRTSAEHDWCEHHINPAHVAMVIDLRKDN